MSIEIRRAEHRFRTRAEGIETWHSFSFGEHYDPDNVGLGALVAFNDERLPAGGGYDDHHHEDTEIVTWVLAGHLRHTSSVGSGLLGPGQVQRLSAGSGVVHSERAEDGPARFLQSWVRPDQTDLAPSYVSAEVALGPEWATVAGADGTGAVVSIASSGATLYAADLPAGETLALPEAPLLQLFVASGTALLGLHALGDDDAARLTDEPGHEVTAATDAQLLVWACRP